MMFRVRSFLVIVVSWILMGAFSVAQDAAETATSDDSPSVTLTIGSVAPPLDVEHWVQDGEGTYKPVTNFKKDNIYVVEFWATWCGPCLTQMPHLSQLQRNYAKKNVTIVSISDEPLETVNDFLTRETEDKKTFGEITKHYCLTTDPDGSVQRDYMLASGQQGIPTAFLVGKDGHIEWIGHPGELEEPLELVVNNKWDRKKFAAELKTDDAIKDALQKGNADLALSLIEKQLGITKSDKTRMKFSQLKLQILIATGREIPLAFFNDLVKTGGSDSRMLDALAWTIYQSAKQGNKTSDELLKAASAAAEKAIKIDPEFGSAMDTLARIVHHQGDLDRAMKLATEAIKHSEGRLKLILANFVEELKKEKKALEDKAQ